MQGEAEGEGLVSQRNSRSCLTKVGRYTMAMRSTTEPDQVVVSALAMPQGDVAVQVHTDQVVSGQFTVTS